MAAWRDLLVVPSTERFVSFMNEAAGRAISHRERQASANWWQGCIEEENKLRDRKAEREGQENKVADIVSGSKIHGESARRERVCVRTLSGTHLIFPCTLALGMW